MHVTNQRLLCRVAFLVLCVLPTLGVIGRIVAHNLPGYRSTLQSELETRLGVGVALDGVSHPRPGILAIKQLRLFDQETNQTLATVENTQIALLAEKTVARLQHVTLDGQSLKKCFQVFHDQTLCIPNQLTQPFQLDASQVVLRRETGDTTFNDVHLHYNSLANHSKATCTFQAVELGLVGPVSVHVTRHHQPPTPLTTFALHTHQSQLPCSTLSSFLPFLTRWGADCTFNGAVWGVAHTNSGWQGEGAFQLANIDLQQGLGDRFPHHWSGQCQLQCDQVKITNGRLVDLRGAVVVRNGQVSNSLLQAASRELHMRQNASPVKGSSDALTEFQEFRVDLQLNQSGLELRGRRRPPYEDVVMYTDTEIILREPDPKHQPLPAMKLVHMMVNPSLNLLVPATRNTMQLLRFLPVPNSSELPWPTGE